jgi:hypothetical protein
MVVGVTGGTSTTMTDSGTGGIGVAAGVSDDHDRRIVADRPDFAHAGVGDANLGRRVRTGPVCTAATRTRRTGLR